MIINLLKSPGLFSVFLPISTKPQLGWSGNVLRFPAQFSLLSIIIIFIIIQILHKSVSWSSFTGVWVTASFLWSPGLFSVFLPISTKPQLGWSGNVLRFPAPFSLLSIIIIFIMIQIFYKSVSWSSFTGVGWQQVFSGLQDSFFSNLADLNYATAWMVWACPPISSSIFFTKYYYYYYYSNFPQEC